MKLYRSQAASFLRIMFGIELGEGLRLLPQTAELALAVEAATEALDRGYTRRLQLHRPLARCRARRRFAEHRVDTLLRQLCRALELADGGRRGPLFAWVLPEGSSPVISLVGQSQLDGLVELLGRLKRCSLPGAAEFAAVWLGKLEEGQTGFAASLQEFLAAQRAYLEAFQDELALREEHLLTVTKAKSLVQAAFPGDRTLQELVWPQQSPVTRGEKEDEQETEPPVG